MAAGQQSIRPARRFPGKKGVVGGDKITGYPTGSSPHSTEAWFRPDDAWVIAGVE